MNEQELRAMVERMIVELAGQAPTPQVKGSDYHPMEPEGNTASGACQIGRASCRERVLCSV